MSDQSKLKIYQGIVQYILEVTSYNLNDIAILAQSTLENICTIYYQNKLPPSFLISEQHLVNLYHLILELSAVQPSHLRYFKERKTRVNNYCKENNCCMGADNPPSCC